MFVSVYVWVTSSASYSVAVTVNLTVLLDSYINWDKLCNISLEDHAAIVLKTRAILFLSL